MMCFSPVMVCYHRLGVYTACRTINRWSVVDIDAHLDRLTLISGLEPSKSQSQPGHTFYTSTRSSATSMPSIVSQSDSHAASTAKQVEQPSEVSTDSLTAHNSSGQQSTFPWRITRDTLRSVAYPILRRLVERFDEFDGGTLSELRMTILVAHRWERNTAERTWTGTRLLQRCNHLVPTNPNPDGKGLAHSEIGDPNHPSHASDHSLHLTKDEKRQLERDLFLELYDVWVFGEYLPEIPSPPIFIDLITAERHNPTVKHVDWATERKKLEAEGTEGANEMVLMDARGRIAEGLSSNFMAVVRKEQRLLQVSDQMMHDMSSSAVWDDAEFVVMTAPDHAVLSGTIRHLMLQCASECNIPVLFDFPTRSHLENGMWLSCAIMSTSRLLLPVTQLNILDTSSSTNSNTAAPQRKPLSASTEILPPLPTKLLNTSNHVISQSYRFPNEHPILSRLIAAIKNKMKESSVNLKS